MVKMYGIKNCTTVKKARQWLEAHHINYTFHDYQLHGLTREQLLTWVKELGWQALLNTRGTTWRLLPTEVKEKIDEQQAIALMLQKTSLIKRPLLDLGNECKLGFAEKDYQQWFS